MLSEIIKNRLQEKNLTLEELHEQTNIPLRHLVSFESGDFSNLPTSVFIHGYLTKIASALELSGEDLWQEFKKDFNKSGTSQTDALPKNRFEQQLKTRRTFLKILKLIPIIIIAIILLGFIAFQIKSLLGNPKLKLESPTADLITKDPSIEVKGFGPINSYIKINGKEIYLSEDGYFNEKIDLNPGLNEIVIETQNKLKKTSTITRHIFKED
jgi:cytoskeletal protein RodZ